MGAPTQLATEFLCVLSLESKERILYFTLDARCAFEYPDDEWPAWDEEQCAPRCFALSCYRVLHKMYYSEAVIIWKQELLAILTLIDYMVVCDEQEYFWQLDKAVFYEQGPLDGAWEVLNYLSVRALEKLQIENRAPSLNLLQLTTAAGIRVIDAKI